jgi:hypothetical protein
LINLCLNLRTFCSEQTSGVKYYEVKFPYLSIFFKLVIYKLKNPKNPSIINDVNNDRAVLSPMFYFISMCRNACFSTLPVHGGFKNPERNALENIDTGTGFSNVFISRSHRFGCFSHITLQRETNKLQHHCQNAGIGLLETKAQIFRHPPSYGEIIFGTGTGNRVLVMEPGPGQDFIQYRMTCGDYY